MLRHLTRLTESAWGQLAVNAEVPDPPTQPNAPADETPQATTTSSETTKEEKKDQRSREEIRQRSGESRGTIGAEVGPEEQ